MLNERYRDSRGDRFPSSAILFERQAQNLAIAHEVVRDNKVIPGPRSDRPVSIETPCELLLAISFLPPEHYVPPTFQQTIPAVSKTTARGSGGGTDADEGRPITPRRSGRLSQAASREHTHQVRIVVSLNPNSDPDSVINFTTSPDHDSSPSSSSPISGESYLTDEVFHLSTPHHGCSTGFVLLDYLGLSTKVRKYTCRNVTLSSIGIAYPPLSTRQSCLGCKSRHRHEPLIIACRIHNSMSCHDY